MKEVSGPTVQDRRCLKSEASSLCGLATHCLHCSRHCLWRAQRHGQHTAHTIDAGIRVSARLVGRTVVRLYKTRRKTQTSLAAWSKCTSYKCTATMHVAVAQSLGPPLIMAIVPLRHCRLFRCIANSSSSLSATRVCRVQSRLFSGIHHRNAQMCTSWS